MVLCPSTNILISPLDDKNIKNLEKIKTYLEINGYNYHQNPYNITRKEYHYFMGNSVVFITQFLKKANIDILSHKDDVLLGMKRSIENFLK